MNRCGFRERHRPRLLCRQLEQQHLVHHLFIAIPLFHIGDRIATAIGNEDRRDPAGIDNARPASPHCCPTPAAFSPSSARHRITNAVQSRGNTLAMSALRRHSSCSTFLARRFSSVSEDCRIFRKVIGEPSDSNCSSYFLPFAVVATQEVLEMGVFVMMPICLQVPADGSADGTGRPSTLGLSLEFSSMLSTCSS